MLDFTFLYFTPALSSMIFEALNISLPSYLSDKYITSVIPDWMMAFEHSLQGKSAV